MSNETKRDVFEKALNDWKQNFISSLPRDGSFEDWSESLSDYSARYASALPDDLPVIPKAVGVSIKEQKAKQSLGGSLFDAIFAANELGRKNVGHVVNWMVDNDETYANAWLTGVWRVEGTGKIVKLEAEERDD